MDINSPLPPRGNLWLACKAEGNLGKHLEVQGLEAQIWDLERGGY